MAEEIKVLKKFRDNVLLANSLGRWLVRLYYSVSPPIADFIAKHDDLQELVRWSLLPLGGFSWMALRIGLVPTAMLVVMLLALLITSSGFQESTTVRG